MKRLRNVDVAIIGGGWTGLLMAKELAARTPLSVLVLERGAAHKPGEYASDMDELEYYIRLRMMQDVSEETVTLRHSAADRALPVRQHGSFLPGSGVGGAGEHWSGIAYRYPPDCFELLTRTREKYGEKRMPEGHAIEDWGITYDELEPYYVRAERLMGISGQAGSNPFEGPRSAGYPTPPMKMPYLAAMFRDAAAKLGYHPYPLPAATTSVAYTNPDGVSRPGCTYCGYCERFGCMIGAKSQPTNTLLPVLNKHRNFTLRPGCWVQRIVHEQGRVRGVVYIDAKGEEYFQPADLVFLASWTLNNTRLLLLSGIEKNVGHNLTHQVAASAVNMFFDQPLNRFMGAGAAGSAIADFDADVFDHTGVDFLRGGTLYSVCYGFKPMTNFGVVPPSVKSRWGSEWKKAAVHWYDRTGRIQLYGEHLAYRGNYMDLDPTYKDRFGKPLVRMTLDWNDNERQMAQFLTAKAVEIARAMGAREIAPFAGLTHYDATRYQGTHVQGGAIMGASPERAVVSPYMQHWEMQNLFVLGASAFPQNPSGNPTLTAVALTYRTADAVVDRYLKRPQML
jgi:gluconate 2-dehydrogenase alpha chain